MCLNRNRRECWAALLAVCGAIAVALTCPDPMVVADDTVGWRGDGKGEFKAIDAPTRWSREDGVAWKSELPATSISSPVVAGEWAFVMAEPNRLLGIRLSDGELVWDRPHEYADVFGAEKASEIERQHKESHGIREKIAELQKQVTTQEEAKSDADAIAALQAQIGEFEKRDAQLTVIPPPQGDATGNTASTPVCDSENVYAVLGNGIVSSHRHDGERNWIRFVGKPMSRHSASPLIAGKFLIVHLEQLVALDLQNGEIVWKTDTPPRNGTPIAMTVGELPIVVTPAGAIIRSDDGKLLGSDLFDLAYCSPVAHEDVVFAAERGRLLAIKLSPDNENSIKSDVLWQTRGAQDDRLASPVVHEGLLFSATGSGILDVVNIAKGKIIKRKRLDLGEGRVDASLSLANGRLYVQSTNGTTVVLEPTAECAEVARNEAEGSSSSPFFVEKRVLVRTPTHMICFGGQDQ